MKKFVLLSIGSIAMGVGAAMGFSAYAKLKKEKEDAEKTNDIMESN